MYVLPLLIMSRSGHNKGSEARRWSLCVLFFAWKLDVELVLSCRRRLEDANFAVSIGWIHSKVSRRKYFNPRTRI